MVIAAAVSGSAPSFGSDNAVGTTRQLNLATSTYPTVLDGMIGSNNNTQLITMAIFETLFAFDAGLKPQPMLAESVDVSQDLKKYTIKLRDVPFHNGQRMTAEDVVTSLTRARQTTTPGKLLFASLDKMQAEGNHTVTLTFTKPQSAVLSLLCDRQMIVMPASILKAAGNKPVAAKDLIGTGPYKFESERAGTQITLAKFDAYVARKEPASGLAGRKQALAQKLVYTAVPSDPTRLSGVLSGQYDWAYAMPSDLFRVYKASPELKTFSLPGSAIVITFNFRTGKFAKNVELRRAVQEGIDIPKIAAAYGPEGTYVISPTVPTSGQGIDSNVGAERWGKGDVTAAKALLAKAGYDGSEIVLMNTSNFTPINSAAIPLKAQLEGIGFKVTMQSETTTTAQARRARGEGWDIAVGSMASVPNALLMPNLACGGVWGGYCNPRMESALAEFMTVDASQHRAVSEKIQRLVYEDVPYIKLFERPSIDITGAKVVGFNEQVFQKFWNVSKKP
jgi:peptide/nickel transport system substrate-binding protein